MQITVVGTGYVGLVSGACFADFGHRVICVDLDEQKIAALKAGYTPIFEPGLEQLVASNVAAERLSFSTDLAASVADADVVFIAVGTPSRPGDGHADLSRVYEASTSIAKAVRGFTVVVNKSTVPVGTGDEIERIIRSTSPAADVVVVSNPEFLREGAAINDFKLPDRIVIGLDDERARAPMIEIYRPFHLNQGPLMFTGRRTAELIKYASNAFLAMKITFINEIADLCDRTGANVQEVARGMGLDNRIGTKFLHAGPGYGGSCFPKDTLALAKTGQDHGSPLRLVETTIQVNEQRKHAMGEKIVQAMGGDVQGKTVAVLGLTFKPNTDDVRDAPSIAIIQLLKQAGARIRAFDPQGMTAARTIISDIEYAKDAYDAATSADCLVLVTEWSTFRTLDLKRIKSAMTTAKLVDLRNVFRRSEAEALGFSYHAVGMPGPSAG
ncbi:UDP-glucose dehydrogenase family protein [Devosia ginsengisoli]|uniref:UDP-glucose 6-dehydrogenase n=1 Tax=Devosia ginsengisoli TaxID=400770 RepID=A0A5B8LTP7_9HYPH|nr:UDP-glucose/GDP-mannose dehydrogenase family protein [Devosia ginsengisoli]QDZ11647.1 UDP-glucose/GDP-mannose dehydrogenase family protein [Devosia ginsengisoli]